jgi:hypothetical protein
MPGMPRVQVSKYSPRQGKSYTSVMEVVDLYLNVDSKELAVELLGDDGPISFTVKVEIS